MFTLAMINTCIIHVDNFYKDLLVGFTWLIPLCLRGWYLVCVYDTFGEQMSIWKLNQLRRIYCIEILLVILGATNSAYCDPSIISKWSKNYSSGNSKEKNYFKNGSRLNQFKILFQLDMLYLKLQHMEKAKFITANDFFPINYAMLYNVSVIQQNK